MWCSRCLSDKYDPFLSAKRQFEDLYSPTTSTPIAKDTKKPLSMSTSLNLKSPVGTSPSSYKSNFRRTSSLRVPKKTPKTLTYSMPKYKPTIQRGISDEGPISSNFIKPEEYDELPVKSQAIVTPDLVPKSPSHRELSAAVVKRDHTASANRRNMRLDLKNSSTDFPLSKTDSLAAFLNFEKELNCDPNDEINNSRNQLNNSVTNTSDRLTEKELKDKSNSLSKKSIDRGAFAELLDSKIENNGNINRGLESQPDLIFSPKHHNPIKLAPIEHPNNALYNKNLNSVITFSQNQQNLSDGNTVKSDTKLLSSNDKITSNSKFLPESTSSSSFESSELTKPITALIESVETLMANNQLHSFNRLPSSGKNENNADSKSSSAEKRSLRRQLKFNKDSFLYDNDSPTMDSESNVTDINNQCDVIETRTFEDTEPQETTVAAVNSINNQHRRKVNDFDNIEKLFDDFDLEEFISSFDDDEKYPIFKNYKELITTRSTGKCDRPSQSNDVSSDDSLTSDEKVDQKESNGKTNTNAIGMNIISTSMFPSMSSPIENLPKSPIHQISHAALHLPKNQSADKKADSNEELDNSFDTRRTELQQLESKERDSQNNIISKTGQINLDDSDMTPAERELLESVQELNRMCDSVTTFQPDSGDELSSVDSYPYTKNLGSKFSIDSAYGR